MPELTAGLTVDGAVAMLAQAEASLRASDELDATIAVMTDRKRASEMAVVSAFCRARGITGLRCRHTDNPGVPSASSA